jgi:hypothetical protein
VYSDIVFVFVMITGIHTKKWAEPVTVGSEDIDALMRSSHYFSTGGACSLTQPLLTPNQWSEERPDAYQMYKPSIQAIKVMLKRKVRAEKPASGQEASAMVQETPAPSEMPEMSVVLHSRMDDDDDAVEQPGMNCK